MPQFTINLFQGYKQDYLIGQFLGFKIQVTVSNEGALLNFQIKMLHFLYPSNKICPELIKIEDKDIPVELKIEIPSKNSKKYQVMIFNKTI